MKKVVVKLNLNDDKGKNKAMQVVSSLSGLESMSIDKDMKLTVIGDIDPVEVVTKLRKRWGAEMVSVGPAKEEKKEEKKDDQKKDEKKEEKDPKKEEEKKKQQVEDLYKAVKGYNPCLYQAPQYYYVVAPPAEENPNNCVIC